MGYERARRMISHERHETRADSSWRGNERVDIFSNVPVAAT
jgi:hypothetical protein